MNGYFCFGIFERIAHEVHQHLLDEVAVAAQEHHGIGQLQFQLQCFHLDAAFQCLGDFAHQVPEIYLA